MDDRTLWLIAVIVLFVVAAVVAVLLAMIIRTAREIDAVAGEIWTTGKRVANNTVHIPILYRVAESVEAIGTRAPAILGAATAIRRHAETCSGCPKCLAAK